MKFLITGATGFIGVHLCHRLVSAGHEVVALVRNPDKAKSLPQKNLQILKGDLSLFKTKELELPGCDVVIHLAGVIVAQDPADYERYNYAAVVDLVECLKRQSWQPRRFLFASSLAASGASDPDRPKREEDPDHPVEPYGQSKLDAEHYLQKEAGFPVTLFRPGAVMGPGDTAFLTVFKMASRHVGIKVRGINQRFSYVYVDDLVDAIAKMAVDSRSDSFTYFTNHSKPAEMVTLWRTLGAALGKKVFIIPIPKSVLYILMRAGTALAKIFPFHNQLDYKQYRQLTTPAFVCSSEALKRDLGWESHTDLRTSVAETTAAYRQAGWL